jgi:membrane protein YdbS with pleckstrin-like domain
VVDVVDVVLVNDYHHATRRSRPRLYDSTKKYGNVADVRRGIQTMAGILWAIIVILFLFWLVGFATHLAGGLIHLVLLIAVVLLIVNLLSGRGARV